MGKILMHHKKHCEANLIFYKKTVEMVLDV